jgi:hypothetical protein
MRPCAGLILERPREGANEHFKEETGEARCRRAGSMKQRE